MRRGLHEGPLVPPNWAGWVLLTGLGLCVARPARAQGLDAVALPLSSLDAIEATDTTDATLDRFPGYAERLPQLPSHASARADVPQDAAQGAAPDAARPTPEAPALHDAPAVVSSPRATGGLPGVPPSVRPPSPPLSASHVARVAFGLCALFALAMIAAHPRVRAFEKRAGFGMFATTAVPFLVLGAISRLPAIGVLTPSVVDELRPLLIFGLGWIGFRVGAEYDVRAFEHVPRGTATFVAISTGLAFLAVGGASMLALAPFVWPVGTRALRDALILGACAAVSAPSGVRAFERAGAFSAEQSRTLRRATRLDDAVPMLVLAIVTAVFRAPSTTRFALPPLGWVFLQVGMGVSLGFVLLAVRASASSPNERSALTLGAVAFCAGMAEYLGFSPLVVAFCAGAIVASLRDRNDDFAHTLLELERPIYLTFFALVGATWEVTALHGWVLVAAYVTARALAKIAAPRLQEIPGMPSPALTGLSLLPSSAVAVAVVVSAQHIYPDFDPVFETVVLVGALASELLTQGAVIVWQRGTPAGSRTPSAAIPCSPKASHDPDDQDEVLL